MEEVPEEKTDECEVIKVQWLNMQVLEGDG